jgi:hypothetical protein
VFTGHVPGRPVSKSASVRGPFISSGGVRDPRLLDRWLCNSDVTSGTASFANTYKGLSAPNSDEWAFTMPIVGGLYTNVNRVANTWYTVASLIGNGFIGNFIGPMIMANTAYCDHRITVDGVSTIIRTTANGNFSGGTTQRPILGYINHPYLRASMVSAPSSMNAFVIATDSKTSNVHGRMMIPSTIQEYGFRHLVFNKSLTYEVSVSVNSNTSPNHYAGLTYMLRD